MSQHFETAAFGELSVSERTPVFQGAFNYNINPKLWKTFHNGGTAVVDQNRLKLASGAGANQTAEIQSRIPLNYKPGQGAMAMFTALFTEGVVGSEQFVGVGDSSDGYAFGYLETSFGIKRWCGGSHETRTLTITTGSGDAENITVTLDGEAVSVGATSTSDTTLTANEVADHDYSGVGRGWCAHVSGSKVTFVSFTSTPYTGTFSVGGTSIVGSFAQDVGGVAPVEFWYPQTDWSEDHASGDHILPLMDWSKGNVFRIQYQWLGYGAIRFFVENPKNGKYLLVHEVKYANDNTLPSIFNPTIPFFARSENTTNTSDVVVHCGSVGLFIEGRDMGYHLVGHGVETTLGYTSSSEKPILTIRNKQVFQGKENRTPIVVNFASIAQDGTKVGKFRWRVGAVLTGASFSDVDASDSVVEVDTSATAVANGDVVFSAGLGKTSGSIIPLAGIGFIILPGGTLTITGESAGNADMTASLNFSEKT